MEKGEFFVASDRYLFDDYEEAMFFSNSKTGKIYMKFVGYDEISEIHFSHRIFNDAIISGREITREEYLAGKPLPISKSS